MTVVRLECILGNYRNFEYVCICICAHVCMYICMKPGEVQGRTFLRCVMAFESISDPMDTLGGWRRTESASPEGKLCQHTGAGVGGWRGRGARLGRVWGRLVEETGTDWWCTEEDTLSSVSCVCSECLSWI